MDLNSICLKMQVLADKSTISPDTENLDGSTIVSVVITGIAVVFIALILLILLVTLYGKIFEVINAKNSKKAEEKVKAQIAPVTAAKPAVDAKPVIESGIEEETVAVIMAAVAAISEGSGTKKLAVKSIKTAKPSRLPWASAGIMENTRPF